MIRPLDLQTLYMNLEKVGKETALSKEAQALAQAHQVQKMQKEHDQGQHAVGKSLPVPEDEGSGKVQTEGRQPSSGEGRPPGKKNSEEPAEEKEKQDPWKDPELGKHVDLSG